MTPSTIQELLREGEVYLRSRDVEGSRLDAELLFAHVAGFDRLKLHTAGNEPPDPEHARRFRALLEERGRRRPMAHILGYRDFYKSRFRVGPAVLIPRPETEELVEFALDALRAMSGEPGQKAILDLCCGSGCIGISIALDMPELTVDLTDISPEALEMARRNAGDILSGSGHGIEPGNRIRFFQGDLFQALAANPAESPPPYAGIVCNPPYIHPDEAGSLEPDVRDFEPHQALFHQDPAGLYAHILRESPKYLQSDGFLHLELAPRWATEVLEEARKCFHEAEIRRDLSGLERFLTARRPG